MEVISGKIKEGELKALLLGYGEIGKGMYEILSKVHTIQIHDPGKGILKTDDYGSGGILLVAFPWSDDFVDIVNFWQTYLHPKATIIFSTVPIGTCSTLNACHFPVEAKHPHIARDVMLNDNCYLGGWDETVHRFLKDAGLRFRALMSPVYTEFLKLRSTAIYGINIEFARYSNEIAQKIGLDYQTIKEYDIAHNALTAKRGTPEHSRYILDAPEGNIGGHCVVPNAKILDEQYPSVLLKEIYKEKE